MDSSFFKSNKNKKEVKEICDVLINVYDCDEKQLKNKSLKELNNLLKIKQKEAIRNKKNPNAFFILKDLPPPKSWKTKTSKKGGVLVVIAFITVMLLFGGLMFWWAFK